MRNFENSSYDMARKLMEFIRDFSDNEEDIKSEIIYLTELFDKMKETTEYNALMHYLDIMFMDSAFNL